jgi:hypothetical protein
VTCAIDAASSPQFKKVGELETDVGSRRATMPRAMEETGGRIEQIKNYVPIVGNTA